MYITIKTLWLKGYSKSAISRITKHDWKTVAKTIKQIEEGKECPEKKNRVKMLDKHKEQIIKWIEEGLSRIRIHEKLQEIGIKTSYSTVKDFVTGIKKKNNIFIRMHSAPGEEAQVDFGYVGYTLDNNMRRRKTWIFNMQLSYSRMSYYEKTYDQKVETFINCHINAFKYFGGIPQTVKIDNLKAAILEANFYEPIYHLNSREL